MRSAAVSTARLDSRFRRHVAAAMASALFAALAASRAHAQFNFPSPDQADMKIDAATRAAVVESLATQVDRRYVFPDVAKRTALALRSRLKKGDFNAITSAKEFADSLTATLHAVGKDRHFHTFYYDRALPPDAFARGEPSAAERAIEELNARRLNHGFERIQRLAGNVGYLELRSFDGSPEAGALAQAAMTLLGNSDALIVDLRRNGGGDPNMIMLLMSWLFPADDRVHVNDFYEREGGRTEQFWTLTSLPGPRYVDKEVYVLTGSRTASAAEEFAYDVKSLRRGTVVGETTAGGANPGAMVRLNDHFAAFISDGRAVNPVTGTNWEGVGVAPDVRVPAGDALKTAHLAALTKLLDKASDPERKAALTRALDQVTATPPEPLDMGGPPNGQPRRVVMGR